VTDYRTDRGSSPGERNAAEPESAGGLSPSERLLELATGFWRTQAVSVAASLGLADELASGPARPEELARALGVDPDALRRLLRYLVCCGLVDGDDDEGYTATETCALLRRDVPGSMHDLAILYGQEFYAAWGHLGDAVRTGRSAFGQAFGLELFDYLAGHPAASTRYNRTMSAGAAFFGLVPEAFALPADGTVVDLAGGNGSLLVQVLAATPGAHGVLFDAKHVLDECDPALRDGGAYADRCELVPGDYFESVPADADVYLLSRVLHSHTDADARAILERCRGGLRPGGAVLVVERVVDPAGHGGISVGYDMHMLAIMGEGRERTEPGFRDLFARAGLSLEAVHRLSLGACLIVGRPG
jgi:O-methyltransferase domain/Dimerisation domain